MRIALKCCAVQIVIIFLLLSGCSVAKPVTAEKVAVAGLDDLQVSEAVFEDGLRGYMALYRNQLLFMEMETHKFHYYVLNLETSECKKIKTIRNASYQNGRSVLVGDKLYFSVDAKEKYVMDFSAGTVKKASCVPKDAVLLTEYNGSLLVRRKDPSDKNADIIEAIDEHGKVVPVIFESSGKTQRICMDGSGDALCAIERKTTDSGEKLFYVRYDRELREVESFELTELFSEYGITESIGNFSVFGNCFFVSDFSNHTAVCLAEQDVLTVLLCENGIMPVKDYSGTDSHVLFRRLHTNEILSLDTHTGEMQALDLTFDTPNKVIKAAEMYDKYLLLIKEIGQSE